MVVSEFKVQNFAIWLLYYIQDLRLFVPIPVVENTKPKRDYLRAVIIRNESQILVKFYE